MLAWIVTATGLCGWLVTARVLFTGWVSGRWAGPYRHPDCKIHGGWDEGGRDRYRRDRCCYDQARFRWESGLATGLVAMIAAVPWPLVVAAMLISRPPRRQRLAAKELAARRRELT